jgi:SHS2 domain-containing protein
MYTYIDHTADVLFQATGKDLPELFRECALAVQETQIALDKVAQKKKVEISGRNKNVEYLLFDFLDDLLLHKDREQLMLVTFDISIKKKNGEYELHCVGQGDTLDVQKHDPRVDVKAITMHEFYVKQEDGLWKAQVLIDI